MPQELIQWNKLTPEERNMLIHTRVMGLPVQVACLAPITWKDDPINNTPRGSWHCQRGHYGVFRDTTHYMPAVPAQYTQSMDAAWLVLQKMAQLSSDDFEECWQKHELLAFLGSQNCFDSRTGELLVTVDLLAKWTPETVCIAALKAVGCTFAEDKDE